MASRHEETVGKKIERMVARYCLTDHRDENLAMPDIVAGCSEELIAIISLYPQWTAAKLIPPIARAVMKDKIRGIRLNGDDVPLLPGFEELKLGFRFAVPPEKVVEDKIEPIDEKSGRTIWWPRHTIDLGSYRRHVGAYQAQVTALQQETDLRQVVLERAEGLGGADEEILIEVLARGV
jgi:hypothetical protein